MSDNFSVIVEGEATLSVSVADDSRIAYVGTPTAITQMAGLQDVDLLTDGVTNGSVLVYKTATNKWTSTLLLNQQIVDAGEF